MTKRLLSGIQPSGSPHIGNYLGAMQQYVDLQDEYESYIFIAEYHALTSIQNPEELSQNIFDIAADYLAIGLDPKRVVLYRQSAVPEVTELTWIFSTLITVPWLQRAHAYKDKTAKGITPSVGLFDYPVLMAADILIVDPDIVPVGDDQRQHVEMAREIAQKFNNTYEEIFKTPKEYIPESVATVPGIDGQKMSKSYNNTIPLFAPKKEVEEAVMNIITDSKTPEDKKSPDDILIFQLYKLVADNVEVEKMRSGFRDGGLGYGEAKKMLISALESRFAAIRERRAELNHDRDYVLGVLEDGASRVRPLIEEKMERVRESVGLSLK